MFSLSATQKNGTSREGIRGDELSLSLSSLREEDSDVSEFFSADAAGEVGETGHLSPRSPRCDIQG